MVGNTRLVVSLVWLPFGFRGHASQNFHYRHNAELWETAEGAISPNANKVSATERKNQFMQNVSKICIMYENKFEDCPNINMAMSEKSAFSSAAYLHRFYKCVIYIMYILYI